MKPFTLIYGPTATGKTARARELAAASGANILSFDSRQLYTDMALGTGRDVADTELAGPPRWYGFNLARPNEAYSIRHFYDYARQIIADHRARRQPLILVGGSWPYARVLLDPPATLFVPPNPSLRSFLAQQSLNELQRLAREQQPLRWRAMNDSDRHNPRRLQRLLELPAYVTAPPPLIAVDEYELLLHTRPEPEIRHNIHVRIEERLAQGVLEETKHLMHTYPDWQYPAFTATGYRHLRTYLEGHCTLEQAKISWHLQERQYAKRQLTWVKSLSHDHTTN